MKANGLPYKSEVRSAAPSSSQVMNSVEWGLIFILSVFWGGSFFFIGVAVKELTPFTIVCCRVLLASAALQIVIRLKGGKMPTDLKIWGAFFIMGALNNIIPFSLIVWGQTHIESSLASILNATTPIFSVILAHFLSGEERLSMNRFVGVVIGWAGVAILIGVESLKGVGVELMGQIAVLGAAFCYACAAIFAKNQFKGMNPMVVAAGMLTGSAVMMTPIAIIVDQPWHLSPGVSSVAAVIALALISTSLAYIIYFRVLSTAGPTNLLLVTFLMPVVSIILGVLILGEQIGWNAFLGMGFIFAGLITIDGRFIGSIRRK